MTEFGNTSNPSTLRIPTTTNYLKGNTKYCNGCPFVEIRPLNKANVFSNWFCAYHKIKSEGETQNIKLIDFKIEQGMFVPSPSFCPKEKKRNLTPKEREKLWKSIKPLNKFEDVEEGCIYHIPPVNGKPRKDIIVIRKYIKTFEYKLYGSKDTSSYYMYDDDISVNFMAKIKGTETF